MHQDVPYFEHEAHSMIAAVVHFDESTIEKGCIWVVPGSWKRGRMDHIGEGGHHLEVEEFPVEQATPCEAEPGDVLFFSYLCIRKCSRSLCVFFRSLKVLLQTARCPTATRPTRAHRCSSSCVILRTDRSSRAPTMWTSFTTHAARA